MYIYIYILDIIWYSLIWLDCMWAYSIHRTQWKSLKFDKKIQPSCRFPDFLFTCSSCFCPLKEPDTEKLCHHVLFIEADHWPEDSSGRSHLCTLLTRVDIEPFLWTGDLQAVLWSNPPRIHVGVLPVRVLRIRAEIGHGGPQWEFCMEVVQPVVHLLIKHR